jgi:hypothetical protein
MEKVYKVRYRYVADLVLLDTAFDFGQFAFIVLHAPWSGHFYGRQRRRQGRGWVLTFQMVLSAWTESFTLSIQNAKVNFHTFSKKQPPPKTPKNETTHRLHHPHNHGGENNGIHATATTTTAVENREQ